MNPSDSILVEILAFSDAIWRPMRAADWQMPTPTVICEHRTAFASSGVPWRASGTSAQRQRAERSLRELADAGLIALHGKERRNCVKLTELGEHRTRALCGLPSIVDSWYLLRDTIARCVIHPTYGGLCRELWLAEPELADYGQHPRQEALLAVVQDYASPSLCRGWLESRSDLDGRAYYLPTDAGLVAADDPPEVPDDLPEEPGAFKMYCENVVQFRERLRGMEPDNPSEIGIVPLPASMPLVKPELPADA